MIDILQAYQIEIVLTGLIVVLFLALTITK
jgi:hypothetical protein